MRGKKKRELFIYNAHCDGRVFVEVMYGARLYISCYMPVMPAVVSSSLFLFLVGMGIFSLRSTKAASIV